ncbi:putative inactive peptidyl-prolyl cis-trans isomerase-like 6 isoform X2 [Macrotis lagotis]|uniref:putative inactive peptidyl-prolyl cis-trans isomerase-like 6 isoform X2 n=1 Tax=Macrotis lagotis TaxID=92651 RepID=UPI003D682315
MGTALRWGSAPGGGPALMDGPPPREPPGPGLCPGLQKAPEAALQLKVVGLLRGTPFQVAKNTAEEMKGEIWQYPSTVMCFVNDQLLGNEGCLQKWAYKRWGYKDFKPTTLYEALTSDYVASYLKQTKRPMVFLEITINQKPIGRLLFELYADLCPKTCVNFRTLCTGKAGYSQSGLRLHYRNTIFHRLVKNGWLQGGDIHMGKGDGGESIFGPTFEDPSRYTWKQKIPLLDLLGP